jgi:hypothetical protein
MLPSWLTQALRRAPAAEGRPGLRSRPRVEQLEDRLVPALAVTDLTSPSVTPTTLVNTLTGSSTSVTVSNIQYTGNSVAAGTFTGGTGIIGFDSGIVLSTGTAKGIIGPNTTGTFTGVHPSAPGDPQLDQLAKAPTFDAAALQFDFVPTGNVLVFQYVFGSDEYNEFVGSPFNDAFAFFLDGQNLALLPGTKTPVTINNVDLQKNAQFYINNALPGDPTPATPPLLDTQLDGLTKVLTVVVNVTPGVSHHIKLAIANASDNLLDSDVMIAAGSFDSPLLRSFRPVRYIAEEPPAGSGSGAAAQPTRYTGNAVITLVTDQTIPAPLFVFIPNLPDNVTVVPAAGHTGSGAPLVPAPSLLRQGLSPSNRTVQLPLTLSNPDEVFMSTFLLGYDLDITEFPSIQ